MALWLVATPIGTLGDIAPRAREVLASAATIAAEDTRTTHKLLHLLGIPAPPLVALHAHNEAERAEALARRAAAEEIALVSDAGTPGISDPGQLVVTAAHRLGVPVLSVPGPSALPTALAASGFPAAPAVFLGFPPRKGRETWAKVALARPETLVIYEAGNRVAGLVAALAAWQPDREACLCRELSKRHEENRRATLAGLAADLGARDAIRGECVLVVGPGEALVPERDALAADAGLGDIAAALAQRWGVPKKDAYRRLLELERG